jgi:hypothetical protein
MRGMKNTIQAAKSNPSRTESLTFAMMMHLLISVHVFVCEIAQCLNREANYEEDAADEED